MTKGETGGMGSRRTTAWILCLILGVGLLVRLLHFWAIAGTAFPRIGRVFSDTDMYANWQWAQSILSGDWLGRDTYHARGSWNESQRTRMPTKSGTCLLA